MFAYTVAGPIWRQLRPAGFSSSKHACKTSSHNRGHEPRTASQSGPQGSFLVVQRRTTHDEWNSLFITKESKWVPSLGHYGPWGSVAQYVATALRRQDKTNSVNLIQELV